MGSNIEPQSSTSVCSGDVYFSESDNAESSEPQVSNVLSPFRKERFSSGVSISSVISFSKDVRATACRSEICVKPSEFSDSPTFDDSSDMTPGGYCESIRPWSLYGGGKRKHHGVVSEVK